MHLGIALPFGDIGGDGPIVREFAELAEAEGYDGLTLADHVLGGNPANPASGRAGGLGLFHDPFVAFGFIAACTKKVELSTQVLILAQRQTVLVAKQAASLDVLSGGRFRFGVGVGWNEIGVRRPQREFPQQGQAVRGTGPGDESAVGRSLRYVRGQVAPPPGRRHQSAAATPQNSAVVRRPHGRDAAADRKVGRRLDHAV